MSRRAIERAAVGMATRAMTATALPSLTAR
jgi:hypothetical protein